jgi:YggT family protein
MGGSYLIQAGTFLIGTLFGLYILAVLLRFLFQLLRVDFYNPISQVLVTVTNPPLLPLRRVIPGLWGLDMASIILLLALEAVKLTLLGLLLGHVPHPAGLTVLCVAELLQTIVWVFLFTIFIRVILSWIAPGTYNPAVSLVVSLSEPIMRPARRLIPPLSGLDLSPIAAIIALYLALILIVQPLLDLGRQLS